MSLILFDVDGTLTESSFKLKKEVTDVLEKLSKKYELCLVSGGSYEKIIDQIGKDNELLFSYIFSENGIVTYKNGKLLYDNDLKYVIDENKIQEIINFVLIYIANLKLPYKRGSFVRFRKGMMYITPIGGDCSKEERISFAKYDEENKVRENMISALEEKFQNYDIEIKIGGQIGLGIHPKGWNKSYILNFIDVYDYDNVYFFGDKCEPHGNDYPLYSHPKIKGYHVNGYKNTLESLDKYFLSK